MKKLLGILGLLIFVGLITAMLSPNFLKVYNIGNLIRRSSLFSIISIGAAFVIITGGIDLSIGSVVALVGCMLPWLIVSQGYSVGAALAWVLTISLAIGIFHGLLITKLKLQPFVVTLCGLLLYRGLARQITGERTQGFGNGFAALRWLASGKMFEETPFPMAYVLAIGGVVTIVWGLFAWLRRRGKDSSEDSAAFSPLWVAALGLLLTIIGASPFWWARVFPNSETLPVRSTGPLLWWAGLVLCGPGTVWFVIVSLVRGKSRVLLTLLAVLVAVGAGIAAYFWAMQLWNEVDLDTMTMMRKLAIVALLAAGLGVSIGGVVWFAGGAVSAGGRRLHVPLFLAVSGAVMALVGATPIPATEMPVPFLIMLALAIVAAIFLNRTIYGRYLLALGRNEQAARYSGINTGRMTVLAYSICALLAGLGGVLFVLDVNSAQPADFGNCYELYAIAAAVLGGCSLRGGEGTILGVILGAAAMQLLRNSITLLDIPNQLEFAIIGTVILIGVIADELVKRIAAKQRAVREASAAASLVGSGSA